VTSCKRKVRYTSHKRAENTRRAQEQETGEPLRVYWCPPCKGWHLTHHPFDPSRRSA